jgi:hypothetical protein
MTSITDLADRIDGSIKLHLALGTADELNVKFDLDSASALAQLLRLTALATEALDRADYYINRLEAAQRGHVVRDLGEACNAWESYRARCKVAAASVTEQIY